MSGVPTRDPQTVPVQVQARRTPPAGSRLWLARGVAVVADLVQLAIFPVVIEGAFSPIDDAFDAIVGVILTLLMGWHIAFVPSFLVKLLPIADLAPTWTIAVMVASIGNRNGASGLPANMLSLLTRHRSKVGAQTVIKPRWARTLAALAVTGMALGPIVLVTDGYIFWRILHGPMPLTVAWPIALNLAAAFASVAALFWLGRVRVALIACVIATAALVWAIALIWPRHPRLAAVQLPYLLWLASIAIVCLLMARRIPATTPSQVPVIDL